MWRCSADTCAGRAVSSTSAAWLLSHSSATCSVSCTCASKNTPLTWAVLEQLLSRKWKSMQGWILTVDVRKKLTLGVSSIFEGFLSGLPFRVRTYVQSAPWIPWISSYCNFQTSPSITVLLSVWFLSFSNAVSIMILSSSSLSLRRVVSNAS